MDVRCEGCRRHGPSGILRNKYVEGDNTYDAGDTLIEKTKSEYPVWPEHPHFDNQPKYAAIDFTTGFYDDAPVPTGSVLPARVYNRRDNTLHTLYDHNGKRLLKNMVQYYRDYEYLYQQRTIETPTKFQLPAIDEQLRSEYKDIITGITSVDVHGTDYFQFEVVSTEGIKEGELIWIDDNPSAEINGIHRIKSIDNSRRFTINKEFVGGTYTALGTVQGTYWLLAENGTKVRKLEAEPNSVDDVIAEKLLHELYYDHTRGMNAGTCLDYTQPLQPYEDWDFEADGNGRTTLRSVPVEKQVPKNWSEEYQAYLTPTDAVTQVLVETGNFRSTSSQSEADNLAYLYGTSTLNCYYENPLLDVRCEDCDFNDQTIDVTADEVITTSTDHLDEYDIANEITMESTIRFNGQPVRDGWGDIIRGYWEATESGTYIVKNKRNYRNYNVVEYRDGEFDAYKYTEEELDDRPDTVEIDKHNYTFTKSDNQNVYRPDPNYAAEESVHVDHDCIKNKNGFGSGWQTQPTFEELYNICNYAKGSTARIMVDQGQFRSFESLEDAYQLALSFGQGQLDCYWASPSMHRYCKFCGYNHEDICDYNTKTAGNCTASVDPQDGDCCEEPKDLIPYEEPAGDATGEACTVKNSNLNNEEEGQRYNGLDETCCCAKYTQGSTTELLLEGNIIQSELSLAEAVDLAKQLGDAQLNCEFGNDRIFLSCKDDYKVEVVHPEGCEGTSRKDDLTYEIYKDAYTSYNSFNEAQRFAEVQATTIAGMLCRDASTWLSQVWNNKDMGAIAGITNHGLHDTMTPNKNFHYHENTYCMEDCDFTFGATRDFAYQNTQGRQDRVWARAYPVKSGRESIDANVHGIQWNNDGCNGPREEDFAPWVRNNSCTGTWYNTTCGLGGHPIVYLAASVHVDGKQFNKGSRKGAGSWYSNVPIAGPSTMFGYNFTVQWTGTEYASLIGVVRNPNQVTDVETVIDSCLANNSLTGHSAIVAAEYFNGAPGTNFGNGNAENRDSSSVKERSWSVENLGYDWSALSGYCVDFYLVFLNCDAHPPYYKDISGCFPKPGELPKKNTKWYYSNHAIDIKSVFTLNSAKSSPIAIPPAVRPEVTSPCVA
jgi:hypothetical protein